MAAVTPPIVPSEVDFIPTEELMAMTPAQLRSIVMRSGIITPRKGPWSPEESLRLVTLVQLMGPQDWVSIASYMGSRNAKQCRERYHQNLDPNLRHDPISEDEARTIMDLYGKYGTAWARIAELLPGRSDNAIKNYVNGLVNKNKRAEGRQAGHHQTAKRRGSRLSIRSDASGSASASASASTSTIAVVAPTPSSLGGSRGLESPTFSDMTDSDGGNNYTLSSTSSWGQVSAAAPQTSPPWWHRPLAQSPDFAQPLTHRPASYQQPAYEASLFAQNSYVQHQDCWRPVSRSSEPSSSILPAARRPSTDLARYSLSGPVLRELTRELVMQTNGLPPMKPQWAGNGVLRTPILPSLDPSATSVPLGHRVDARMAIANLLG